MAATQEEIIAGLAEIIEEVTGIEPSEVTPEKSFVDDLLTDANDAAIARTILALAGALELKVVAEGVETEEQFAFLSAQGCQTFQGYLFGRPQPAEVLLAGLDAAPA